MGATEVDAGYECFGNSPRVIQGLSSNGHWTGVPLRAVLERAGVQTGTREVVFIGADKRPESFDFRGRASEIDQSFARSLSLPDASIAAMLEEHAGENGSLDHAPGPAPVLGERSDLGDHAADPPNTPRCWRLLRSRPARFASNSCLPATCHPSSRTG